VNAGLSRCSRGRRFDVGAFSPSTVLRHRSHLSNPGFSTSTATVSTQTGARIDAPLFEVIVDRLKEYEALGVEHFMLWFMDFPSLQGIRLFAAEVMPKVRSRGSPR